jgi:hypothetical protein
MLPNQVEDVPQIEVGNRTDELFKYVTTLYRQGERTSEEIEVLAMEFNSERCAEPLPDTKITSMVSSVGKTNKPKKKTGDYRLWYFPNLAKDDLQNMSYLELTTLQRGWRAVLEKHAWLNKGKLPADKNKLLMLALVHDPVEREQFLEEDIQTILYDFELRTDATGTFWFNEFMDAECKRIQKNIHTKVENGKKSAAKRKQRADVAVVEVEKRP